MSSTIGLESEDSIVLRSNVHFQIILSIFNTDRCFFVIILKTHEIQHVFEKNTDINYVL